MNLAQIVTAIGQRTGQIGPRDVTACRNFVGIRYNQLWQAFLWKDALVEYVVTIDPGVAYVPTSPYMPAKGHLILPSVIGNVIAVRSNLDKMNVERPMMYFRVGQDQFSKTGQPCEFYLLASCAWEFDTSWFIGLTAANAADYAQAVTTDLASDSSLTVTRVKTNLGAGNVVVGETDRLDTVLKPVTLGTVSVTAPFVTLTNSDVVDLTWVVVPGAASSTNTGVLAPGETVSLPLPLTTLTITTNSTVGNFPGLGAFNGTIEWTANPLATFTPVALSTVLTLQPTDTAAPKRQRVRFVRIPDTALTIRVLGKRVTPQLSDDNDEPAVKGMDGLLYAMATYDMAHRDEFSKVGAAEAQILLTESVGPNFLSNGVPGGFLKKLIEEECDQSAFNSRIMPEYGFGGHELDGCNSTKSNPYGF